MAEAPTPDPVRDYLADDQLWPRPWPGCCSPDVARVADVAPAVARVADVTPAVTRVADVAPAVTRVADVTPAVTRVADVAPAVTRVADWPGLLEWPPPWPGLLEWPPPWPGLLLVKSVGVMAFDGLAVNAPATDPVSNTISVMVAVESRCAERSHEGPASGALHIPPSFPAES